MWLTSVFIWLAIFLPLACAAETNSGRIDVQLGIFLNVLRSIEDPGSPKPVGKALEEVNAGSVSQSIQLLLLAALHFERTKALEILFRYMRDQSMLEQMDRFETEVLLPLLQADQYEKFCKLIGLLRDAHEIGTEALKSLVRQKITSINMESRSRYDVFTELCDSFVELVGRLRSVTDGNGDVCNGAESAEEDGEDASSEEEVGFQKFKSICSQPILTYISSLLPQASTENNPVMDAPSSENCDDGQGPIVHATGHVDQAEPDDDPFPENHSTEERTKDDLIPVDNHFNSLQTDLDEQTLLETPAPPRVNDTFMKVEPLAEIYDIGKGQAKRTQRLPNENPRKTKSKVEGPLVHGSSETENYHEKIDSDYSNQEVDNIEEEVHQEEVVEKDLVKHKKFESKRKPFIHRKKKAALLGRRKATKVKFKQTKVTPLDPPALPEEQSRSAGSRRKMSKEELERAQMVASLTTICTILFFPFIGFGVFRLAAYDQLFMYR